MGETSFASERSELLTVFATWLGELSTHAASVGVEIWKHGLGVVSHGEEYKITCIEWVSQLDDQDEMFELDS